MVPDIVYVLSLEWPPNERPCDGLSVNGVFRSAASAITYLFDAVIGPPFDIPPSFKPFGDGGWSIWLVTPREEYEYLVVKQEVMP